MNTLIDVGNDPSIIDVIESMNGGAGKKKVDQVVLTHSHYDHTGILPLIKKAFHPKIYAFSPFMDGVDHPLKHGDTLRIGDENFEVLHTPGHSTDSICLHNKEHGSLFVGDTPVIIHSASSTHEEAFYRVMADLCRKNIKAIYFGHGEPLSRSVLEILKTSLDNIRKNRSRACGTSKTENAPAQQSPN